MVETRIRPTLRQYAAYALVRVLSALFAALPLDLASGLGGVIGCAVGPLTPMHRRARANLARALPEIGAGARRRILRGMWAHIGRVFAEYPHLGHFRLYDGSGRVEVIGAEHVDALREDGIGGIFVAGHIGNWELASLGATQRGVPLVHVYRAANNPLIERLIQRWRSAVGGVHHPKSPRAARSLVAALAAGEHLGMLVDQKYNEGIAVPFFGRDAMTAPALAELALKFKVPVVAARVERLKGARFRLTVLPPLDIARTGDRAGDVRAVMTRINALFEDWIRDRPEQWLWMHRRWPENRD